MKTVDFIREHNACRDGAKWALSIGKDMSAVWDALVEQEKHEWLLWTLSQPGVFPESILRRLACRFVRETPLCDGRTVWNLLTDERSRKAVEVAESYVDGKATEAGLAAAYSAARAACYAACTAFYDDRAAARSDASYAACSAASAAARAAAYAARAARAAVCADASYTAYAAADDVARADAYDAQIQMIAELGNPFNKEPSNENC